MVFRKYNITYYDPQYAFGKTQVNPKGELEINVTIIQVVPAAQSYVRSVCCIIDNNHYFISRSKQKCLSKIPLVIHTQWLYRAKSIIYAK